MGIKILEIQYNLFTLPQYEYEETVCYKCLPIWCLCRDHNVYSVCLCKVDNTFSTISPPIPADRWPDLTSSTHTALLAWIFSPREESSYAACFSSAPTGLHLLYHLTLLLRCEKVLSQDKWFVIFSSRDGEALWRASWISGVSFRDDQGLTGFCLTESQSFWASEIKWEQHCEKALIVRRQLIWFLTWHSVRMRMYFLVHSSFLIITF